jgi:hypothetical protein
MTDISVDEAKQAIRERLWSLLEVRQAVAPGIHGRIPEFHGADEAADRLATLPAWQSAQVTKIAVGTAVAGGPPRRSQRAELPHWAPALGSGVEPRVGERMPQAGGW